jgi:hypothetical protein
MKYISKLLSALLILALLAIPASAGVQNRDVNLLGRSGDFESGAGNWVDSTNGLFTVQSGKGDITGDYVGRVTRDSASTLGYARANGLNLTVGALYTVSGQWRAVGTNAYPRILVGNGGLIFGPAGSEWSSFSQTVECASNSSFYIGVGGNAVGDFAEFDNLSITRYYGTVQNREVNLLQTGNMEKSGTTGYARINSSTLTKAANTWNLEGKQVLKVENNNVNKAFGLSPPASVLTGERWRVRGRVKSSDASLRPIAYRIGGASQALWIGANSTDVQYMDAVTTMNADGTITFYCTEPSLTANYCEWDDISITRYYGAVQNRDTALGTDLNFEKAGTSDFGVVFANLTKETNDRGDDGKQFLRVEYDGGVGNAYAAQAILTIGVPHKITGYWRTGDANYVCRLVAYGAGGITFGTTNSTSWIPFSYTFTPNFAILGLGSTQIGRIGSYCDYDNISVTRVY